MKTSGARGTGRGNFQWFVALVVYPIALLCVRVGLCVCVVCVCARARARVNVLTDGHYSKNIEIDNSKLMCLVVGKCRTPFDPLPDVRVFRLYVITQLWSLRLVNPRKQFTLRSCVHLKKKLVKSQLKLYLL